MSFPVTEVVYITLLPQTDLDAEPFAQVWSDTLSTIASQAGFRGQYFGRQYEDPDTLMLLTDWTSLNAHHAFMHNAAVYAPFVARLRRVTRALYFHHVRSAPFPPAVLARAPCVEFATFYGVADGFAANARRFLAAVGEGRPVEYFGSAWGEVVEDVGRRKGKGKGEKEEEEAKEEKGRGVVLFLGWASREAHERFRETELFRKNVGLLEEKHCGVEMCHVSFKEYEAV